MNFLNGDPKIERPYSELLIRHTSAGLVLLEGLDAIIHCNEAFLGLFQFEKTDDVKGRTLSIIHPSMDSYSAFKEKVRQAANWKRPLLMESTLTTARGIFVPVEMTVNPVQEDGGLITHTIVTFRDISTWKKQEQELIHKATRDSLTGLPNRVLFNDRLSLALIQAHRNKERLSIMFINMDMFNDINHRYGYTVGDVLLKEVARRIKQCLRNGDTVARFEGDEFIVLLPGVTRKDDITRVTERIIMSLNDRFIIDGGEIFLTASIGLSVFPENGDTREELVKHADIAMRSVKVSGRNNYRFYWDVI